MVSRYAIFSKTADVKIITDYIIIFCKKCGTFFRFSIEKSFYLLYNVLDEDF